MPGKRPNFIAALILMSILGLGFWAITDYLHHSLTGSVPPLVPSLGAPQQEPSPSPSVKSAQTESRPDKNQLRDIQWRDFKDKFGDSLKPVFTADGRLASLRTIGSNRERGQGNYDSKDPQKLIVRAKEILDAVAPLLGVEPGLPLGLPLARGGEVSGQVSFRETYRGVPIEPRGGVQIDLGPEGELNGLYSTYVPGILPSNGVSLTSDDAQERAVAAVVQTTGLRPEGGRLVVWAMGSDSREAYVFNVQGRQVVIDAATGAVISSRDARHF